MCIYMYRGSCNFHQLPKFVLEIFSKGKFSEAERVLEIFLQSTLISHWKFSLIHHLFENFIEQKLPDIQKLTNMGPHHKYEKEIKYTT